jgi:hypothetical protein
VREYLRIEQGSIAVGIALVILSMELVQTIIYNKKSLESKLL